MMLYIAYHLLLCHHAVSWQAQFEAIAQAQVTELWSQFGDLNEIWFDGGYTSDMQAGIIPTVAGRLPLWVCLRA